MSEGTTTTGSKETPIGTGNESNGNSPNANDDEWNIPSKFCRVCGDHAISFNFGVVTCESCKAFFRRNAMREKELRCPFYDNCPMNVRTRRHCMKCRLRKCFEVGMAQDTSAKNRQKQQRMAGRNDEDGDDAGSPAVVDTSGTDDGEITISLRLPPSLRADQCVEDIAKKMGIAIRSTLAAQCGGSDEGTSQIDSMLNILIQQKQKNGEFRNGLVQFDSTSLKRHYDGDDTDSLDVPGKFPRRTISSLPQLCSDDVLGTISSTTLVLPADRKANFGTDHEDLSSLEFPYALPMTMKHVKMDELLMTTDEIRDYHSNLPPLDGTCARDFTIDDYHKLGYHVLMYTIVQHRRLAAFRTLNKKDQYTLMKARVKEIGLIRIPIKHTQDSGQISVGYPGRPTVSVDIARRVRGDFYREIQKFMTTFPNDYRSDSRIFIILSAVALFNPESLKLEDKTAVVAEQRVYLQLLREYLESAYGQTDGTWAYRYLTTWLSSLSLWNNWQCVPIDFELNPSTLTVCELSVRRCVT